MFVVKEVCFNVYKKREVYLMAFVGYLWDEFLGLGKLAFPTLVINGLEISMNVSFIPLLSFYFSILICAYTAFPTHFIFFLFFLFFFL